MDYIPNVLQPQVEVVNMEVSEPFQDITRPMYRQHVEMRVGGKSLWLCGDSLNYLSGLLFVGGVGAVGLVYLIHHDVARLLQLAPELPQ